MRKKYIEPAISIQKFVVEDIVTASTYDYPHADLGEMGENVVQDELP